MPINELGCEYPAPTKVFTPSESPHSPSKACHRCPSPRPPPPRSSLLLSLPLLPPAILSRRTASPRLHASSLNSGTPTLSYHFLVSVPLRILIPSSPQSVYCP